MFAKLALQLLAAATAVTALPNPANLVSRAVIDHDAVVGFPETVPNNIAGGLYLKYKPWLKVFNGCVPFPAVNAAGDTSAGLAPRGASDGDCSSSTGQVYVRGGAYNGAFAIMYSWYMPKDEPSDGIGHRHDWENMVVWLSAESDSATVTGVAISAHGGYQKYTDAPFSGTRPEIGYISYWPLDHQLISTTTRGGEQPAIAWESMTAAARSAIENTDFGDATPSFRDDNFQNYLSEAWM
ncbi:hypothetical protein ACEQ8H_003445 [Pleosporales sp. CAS-2024a]